LSTVNQLYAFYINEISAKRKNLEKHFPDGKILYKRYFSAFEPTGNMNSATQYERADISDSSIIMNFENDKKGIECKIY